MFSYLPVPAPIPTWKLKAFWMLISAVSNPPESPGIVDSGTYFFRSFRCIFYYDKVTHEETAENLVPLRYGPKVEG